MYFQIMPYRTAGEKEENEEGKLLTGDCLSDRKVDTFAIWPAQRNQ